MTDAEHNEARRIEAVRRFQADQGGFPGILGVLHHARRAEIEADERSEDAPASMRVALEPVAVEV